MEGVGEGEEEEAVAEEGGEGADEEEEPRGELVAGEAGEEAEVFADVVGHAEEGHLALVEQEDRFQRVGVEREGEGVSRRDLDPHRGGQPHPRWPASAF